MSVMPNQPPLNEFTADSGDVAMDKATQTLDTEDLEEEIISALKMVYDPEIPVNVYDLGLIYDLNVDNEGHAEVVMTLTAPGCPVAGSMPGWVKDAVENVPGVTSADVELAWEPPWTQEMMSMRAKLELNMI
jgi:FeS assembly SUF system protein